MYIVFQNVCQGTSDSIVQQHVFILHTETDVRDIVTVAKAHVMCLQAV